MQALEDPRITTIGLLLEAHAGVAAVLDADLQAAAGLPLTWFEVLLRLARAPDTQLRMTDLAAAVTLSTSGLTRLIDRMEAAGLVTRRPCPSDRRGSFAALTEAGWERLEQAIGPHLASIDRHVLAHLDPCEVEALEGALRRLRDALHSAAGERPCEG